MGSTTEGNWGTGIVALLILLLILVIIVSVLRIITRIWIVHSFWWDDVTIILAVVCVESIRYASIANPS